MELREITVRKSNTLYDVALHYDTVTMYKDLRTYEEVGELIAGNCCKTTFINCASDFIIPKQ